MIYITKFKVSYLLGFYYLISLKDYLKNKSICKPISIMQYLQKLVNFFYKDHFNKPIITFLPIGSTFPITKYIVLSNINSK